MTFRRSEALATDLPQTTSLPQPAYALLVKSVVEGTVSRIFDVPQSEFAASSRGPAEIAFARQVAMYLSHVAGGLSLTEVGRIFSRDRTTVSYACLTVEDRRDDRRLDRALEMIEAILKRVAPPASLALVERRRPYQRRSVA